MVHPIIFFLSILDLFAKTKVKFFAPQKEIMYMYLYTRETKHVLLYQEELISISWRHIFRQIQNKNHKLHAEIRHWRDKHNPPWNFEMRRSPENIAEPL